MYLTYWCCIGLVGNGGYGLGRLRLPLQNVLRVGHSFSQDPEFRGSPVLLAQIFPSLAKLDHMIPLYTAKVPSGFLPSGFLQMKFYTEGLLLLKHIGGCGSEARQYEVYSVEVSLGEFHAEKQDSGVCGPPSLRSGNVGSRAGLRARNPGDRTSVCAGNGAIELGGAAPTLVVMLQRSGMSVCCVSWKIVELSEVVREWKLAQHKR
ncbi:hypothetical protein B0H14DRAFT_2578178 [Mycena olivaceomarginata]|nr:hypothetical protein B0H14DRAFT_2578178 [Mycena olivaceomarginata]